MLIAFLGIGVHVLFFASIFDIYFRSPVIQGLTAYSPTYEPPAKRLLLFVADGLRADKLFELNRGVSNAPFLRNVISTKGCWGISHTRVPTESRPGHVAIIAGFYEDVSAVTKGWKENPVDFDSVFNQSRFTWAWGSPDILPIFSKASAKISNEMYTANEEDFAGEDPSNLDVWVAEKFENFFKHAQENDTLASMLKEDRIVFFLHLLGLDTIGHSLKPQSNEYSIAIKLVDKLVEKCTIIINEFYGDEKTAFIFTSDHGMTDWGTHGAGNSDETKTPLVAWGAGIRTPKGAGKDNQQDDLSEIWRLPTIRRSDVNQADIAPLMSSLIGVPIPVNSVGILPVEYLGTDMKIKAEALILNANQITIQYKAKAKEKKQTSLVFFYRPFKEFTQVKENQYLEMIDIFTKQKRYHDSIKVSEKIIELALKGLNYYQKYDRFALCFSILLSFMGWMSYIILVIVEKHTYLMHTTLESNACLSEDSFFPKIKIFLMFLLIAMGVSFLLHVQSSPFMHYCYFLLPIFLWMLVCFKSNVSYRIKDYLSETDSWTWAIFCVFLTFLGLELLVLSFFYRTLYTIILISLSIWPYCTRLKESHKLLSIGWCLTCMTMAVFPILPVVGRNSNYNLVTLSGWISIICTAFCARRKEIGLVRTRRDSIRREPFHIVVITGIQLFILMLSTYTVKSASTSISNKHGLPVWCQIISWAILCTSIFLPLFGSTSMLTRLLNIVASFLAVILLMSISHELLFCLGLCVLLLFWLCIEHQLNNFSIPLHDISFVSDWWTQQKKKSSQKITSDDLRRSYFFLFLILFAFFGVGNIASINSFEITSVYCFLTVFSPFTMGFLLLLKILIPFVLVSCFFRAILVSIKVSTQALFLIVLFFSDFMAMNFFFFVKDSGSWLEIGTSISHYVIMMTTILFVMVLYGFAWLLTTVQLNIPILRSKRHVL